MKEVTMRTSMTSCLVATAWMVLCTPLHAAGDSAPVSVTLRVGSKVRFADVVKIVQALEKSRGSEVKLEIAVKKVAGVSAVVRARSDAPYQAVVRSLEALQGAGVPRADLHPKP